MALHRFLGMEIGVPDPTTLEGFYREIGLQGSGHRWGTTDVPDQIDIVEAPYRQLRAMRIGCEDERDLREIATRLEGLGVPKTQRAGELRCADPTGDWDVVIQVADPMKLSAQSHRPRNRPGERERSNTRAEAVIEDEARPPRRLGHVVVGSPDPIGTAAFFRDGLGFRTSDVVAGIATFLRCSSDHHNLLVAPGPIPYLNHYAFELDDTDSVANAASRYLAGRTEDHHIVGIGRHVVGSNVYWYLKDPCGTMFEFFSDMDDIPDDEAWEIGTDWPPNAFSKWGPAEPPEVFFAPEDLGQLATLREREAR